MRSAPDQTGHGRSRGLTNSVGASSRSSGFRAGEKRRARKLTNALSLAPGATPAQRRQQSDLDRSRRL
jgi:hypothetical protein